MGFLSKVRLLIATENIPEWEQDLDPRTDIQALYVHFNNTCRPERRSEASQEQVPR